jgi:hypothetical protein
MNELLTAPPTARATEIVIEIAIVNGTVSEIGAEIEKDLVTGPIATTAVTTTRAVTTSRTHGTIEPPSQRAASKCIAFKRSLLTALCLVLCPP